MNCKKCGGKLQAIEYCGHCGAQSGRRIDEVGIIDEAAPDEYQQGLPWLTDSESKEDVLDFAQKFAERLFAELASSGDEHIVGAAQRAAFVGVMKLTVTKVLEWALHSTGFAVAEFGDGGSVVAAIGPYLRVSIPYVGLIATDKEFLKFIEALPSTGTQH